MPESDAHVRLVAELAAWLRKANLVADGDLVLQDGPGIVAGKRLPAIGRRFPDVYTEPRGRAGPIIGEAKTATDLESRHTAKQLEGYLAWCSSRLGSLLVLAVPWESSRHARDLLAHIQRRTGTESVQTVVPDKLA